MLQRVVLLTARARGTIRTPQLDLATVKSPDLTPFSGPC